MLIQFAHLATRIPVVGALLVRAKARWIHNEVTILDKFLDLIETVRPFKVRRLYLIRIAFQNLLSRKSRSLVTILGMSIGVGIIVYLLSLGYGIEKLVISQVATLNELKMVDVSAGESASVKINNTVMDRIAKIVSVKQVIPFISVVGRINYKNAKTDVLVYAVTDDYLKLSNLTLIEGKYFANDSWYFAKNDLQGTVAGAETQLARGRAGQEITGNTVLFNVLPVEEVPAWKSCDISSDIYGYTARIEGGYEGVEQWGSEYYPLNPYGRTAYSADTKLYLGKWVKGKVPIYTKNADNALVPVLDDQGRQLWEVACLERKFVQVTDEQKNPDVLGISTVDPGEAPAEEEVLASMDEATASGSLQDTYDTYVVATDSAGIETVKLEASASAALASNQQRDANVLKYKEKPSGTAVVSTGLLRLLNIPNNKAVNTTFTAQYIIVRSLLPSTQSRVLSEEIEYKVVGVTEDDEKQFFYIPFTDMQKLGVSNYSQLKVVLETKDTLKNVRNNIETLGLNTSSAIDTVAQIESFFASLRVILGLIGLIALGVASLGMFNTLTVSLLERTREIGGMKTIGMVSDEIQDLFLAEAMIMGFGGGLGGLLLGYLVGKLSSVIVSIIAISQGIGYLELTYIPTYLVIFIIFCSFVVGIVTGLYPAQRARKISALNALRYE
jgi:ABC-type lipoprotein release transport system permease subunit